MNHEPEKLIVRAIIPSEEDPDVHITDSAGLYPVEVTDLSSNQEHILHEIGQKVLIGSFLAVDVQINRQNIRDYNGNYINICDLRTKPISPETPLTDKYRWNRI